MKTDIYLSRVGLGLIFCYCLLASIFFSPFAQIHLTLHFLPFPVFIGEILLLICLVFFLKVAKGAKLFSRQSVVLLSLYFSWVLIKACIDYCYDGPLTCRNAALFYYPIFGVFAYCFYRKAQIPREVFMSLAFLAAGIMFIKGMVVWYWWTYVILLILAISHARSVKWRWLGSIFLVFIFLLGNEYFYKGPRAHFVSVFGSILFLTFYWGALFARNHNYLRLGFLIISFTVFIAGFFYFSDRNAISSIISLRGIKASFDDFDRELQTQQAGFVPAKLSVHLYNPKDFKNPFLFLSLQPKTSVSALSPSASPPDYKKDILPDWWRNITSSDIMRCHIRQWRTLDGDQVNTVFRLFIWRDMARELIEKKAWFGFSFGHPQRSRSLEVLHWAESEWSRDGWITPHNSFFHIIYRAGILGVGLIGILFYMMAKLTRDFFDLNSFEGSILVAGLVYWLILSNFFVILEFPYNAIVFWSLFGITWAYHDGIKK